MVFRSNQLPPQLTSWRHRSEKQLLHVTVEKPQKKTNDEDQEEEIILFSMQNG